MGAASARALARLGRSVVLLEQFEPAHARGSSHGGSRISRLAYPDPFWIDLARTAQTDWRELEAETGAVLLTQTGSVDHGDPAAVLEIGSALAAAGVPFELLHPDEAAGRWSGMRFDGEVLHQSEGGRLDAALALRTLTESVERLGGAVRWSTPVRALEPTGNRVRIFTDSETYDADVVVVAAGAWVEPLLEQLVPLPRMVVTQESAFHFAPSDPLPWPSFIHHGPTTRYGLETPGEGVKVAEHHTGPEMTAATRDFVVDPAARERTIGFVETWLPGLSPLPVTEVTCLYTSTATEDFVVDRIGPIVVASPCSGHGFKFAPTIGKIVAGVVAGEAPIARFALARLP